MVTYLIAGLLLKSGISLKLYKMLKKTRINSTNDVNEKLSGRPLLGVKLVGHIPFDRRIIFHLFDEVLHVELVVVRKRYSIDLIVLEAGLLITKQLADEQTVHNVVFVHVTLAIKQQLGS